MSVSMIRALDIQSETLTWMWPRYIPDGKLTLLDGDPDFGKSLITIDLAARMSRGLPFPDGSTSGALRRTLFVQAEDGAADTLIPRLTAAGADLDHIFVLKADDERLRPIRLPRHVRRIEELVRAESIGLVVIDPLIAFLSRGISVANDRHMRRALGPMAKVAAQTRTAFALVRHLNKKHDQRALYRGSGSIGIMGTARSGLLVADHPNEQGQRILTVAKSNLTGRPPALGYRVIETENGLPRIEWTGPVQMSADDALRPERDSRRPENGVVFASEWLVQILRNGPRPAMEILREALKIPISERTLDRAKSRIGVRSLLSNVGGTSLGWLWELRQTHYADLPALGDLPELRELT
jgi:AAA domain